MPEKSYLTTAEAARFLDLSPRTLERWRGTGNGPMYRKLGRAVRYAVADLEGFAAANARSSTSGTVGVRSGWSSRALS